MRIDVGHHVTLVKISIFLSPLLAAVVGCGSPALGADIPPPQITIETDRQSATVGDRIAYTLTVVYDSALRLIPPARERTLGSFDVLHDTVLSDAAVRDGSRVYQRRWRLAAFRIGDQWIPAASGELVTPTGERASWQSDSMLITIASVLVNAPDTTDIRGLKDPYWAPVSRWIWWAAAAVATAAAALWWWRSRRRRTTAAPAAPPIPAWDIALAALRDLSRQVDPEHDGARQWYFGLSEILRRYWDARYGWKSIDQTTPEILPRLQDAPFNGTHRERAREFLRTADLVRYARMAARAAQAHSDWEWVRAFVEHTTPRIAPSPPGAAVPPTVTAQEDADGVRTLGRGEAP